MRSPARVNPEGHQRPAIASTRGHFLSTSRGRPCARTEAGPSRDADRSWYVPRNAPRGGRTLDLSEYSIAPDIPYATLAEALRALVRRILVGRSERSVSAVNRATSPSRSGARTIL